jgi:hypothetical protein
MSSKPIIRFTYLILFAAIAVSSAFAQCNKADIEFYLEKGFTQDQITQLCANSESSTPDYQPYQQKVIIYQEGAGPDIDKDGFTREEREAIDALEAGGDVTKLKVTPELITYTRKVCVFSTNGPDYEDRYKACPEADFSIPRNNIKVSHSGKTLIFLGSATVQVEGKIDIKLEEGFDSYPVDVRKGLERNFHWRENGKVTDFPVRGDYSVTRIVNAFRTLASTYKGDESDNTDKIAEANSRQSKGIIQKANEPKKEKKKRWWNPFD